MCAISNTMVQNKNSIPLLHKYKSNSEKQPLEKNIGIMETRHLWKIIFTLHVHITNENINNSPHLLSVLLVPAIALGSCCGWPHLLCTPTKAIRLFITHFSQMSELRLPYVKSFLTITLSDSEFQLKSSDSSCGIYSHHPIFPSNKDVNFNFSRNVCCYIVIFFCLLLH